MWCQSCAMISLIVNFCKLVERKDVIYILLFTTIALCFFSSIFVIFIKLNKISENF